MCLSLNGSFLLVALTIVCIFSNRKIIIHGERAREKNDAQRLEIYMFTRNNVLIFSTELQQEIVFRAILFAIFKREKILVYTKRPFVATIKCALNAFDCSKRFVPRKTRVCATKATNQIKMNVRRQLSLLLYIDASEWRLLCQ